MRKVLSSCFLGLIFAIGTIAVWANSPACDPTIVVGGKVCTLVGSSGCGPNEHPCVEVCSYICN